MDNDKLLKIISIRYNIYLHSGQKYITTTVAQDVSKETMVAIQENASTLKGVKAEEQNIRKYNDSLYYAQFLDIQEQFLKLSLKNLMLREKTILVAMLLVRLV